MRPSSVETSEPAWVKRKMLSIKSRTSCFCTSRKYSAIVSADSATRRRVPGGSSIWPKTSAVFSMTPESVISAMRSLPSRVRSPTPANTGTAEQADLAADHVRGQQVDDLDAGPERLGLRLELVEGRRLAVDRPALLDVQLVGRDIERYTERVEDVALGHVTDRDGDGRATVGHLGTAHQTVGR